ILYNDGGGDDRRQPVDGPLSVPDIAKQMRAEGITYKILYNDGGGDDRRQPVDGPLSVPDIAKQMRAEGI
ncbi:hypothetical protein C7E25_25275, partial [Stenotrophomonas maltophilia]